MLLVRLVEDQLLSSSGDERLQVRAVRIQTTIATEQFDKNIMHIETTIATQQFDKNKPRHCFVNCSQKRT
jgi:hypothetical protein